MTQYEMACTNNINRINDELETRNREGWEPINLAITDKLACVLFKSKEN